MMEQKRRNPDKAKNSPKVLLIGLDAVTWDVLTPLVQQGKVPHLAKLMQEGVYGKLQSIEPMMSPVVWTSIATGKKPQKHGATNFYSTQGCLKTLRIWEILSEFGKTVGLFEWLLTSPPKPLKEFVVPGWLATTPDTYPPELECIKNLTFQGKRGGTPLAEYFRLSLEGMKNGLKVSTAFKAFLHSLYLKLMRPDFYEMHHKTILMKQRIQGDFATHLLKKYQPDFSGIIFYATDQIPHHYWKFMESSGFDDVSDEDRAKYGRIIPETYQECDRLVGRILGCVPGDTNVLVISDHGMESVSDAGYVFKVDEFLKYLDFPEKDRLQVQIIKNDMHIGINAKQDSEKQTVQKRLMECMSGIKIVEGDEGLFHLDLDEYGNIMAATNLESVDMTECRVYFPPNNIVRLEALIETENLLSAKHSQDGIFIMKGVNILKNKELRPCSILDVAPTVLALTGFPVESDMDGKVIEEAFEEGYFQRNPIEYIDSYAKYFGKNLDGAEESHRGELSDEETEEIKEKLRGLGYLE